MALSPPVQEQWHGPANRQPPSRLPKIPLLSLCRRPRPCPSPSSRRSERRTLPMHKRTLLPALPRRRWLADGVRIRRRAGVERRAVRRLRPASEDQICLQRQLPLPRSRLGQDRRHLQLLLLGWPRRRRRQARQLARRLPLRLHHRLRPNQTTCQRRHRTSQKRARLPLRLHLKRPVRATETPCTPLHRSLPIPSSCTRLTKNLIWSCSPCRIQTSGTPSV